MSYTLSDGGDYGLNESDMQASVATIRSMCEQIEADLILLRERAEAGGQVRDYLIRRRVGEADFLEVRWVMRKVTVQFKGLLHPKIKMLSLIT